MTKFDQIKIKNKIETLKVEDKMGYFSLLKLIKKNTLNDLCLGCPEIILVVS